MAVDPAQAFTIQVSPSFQSAVPALPAQSEQVAQLSTLATTPDSRDKLSCQRLLVGDTLARAQTQAAELLPKVLANTQLVGTLGKGALTAVNALSDRMLRERPPVEIPELRDAMKALSREMRGISSKYDPTDPKVRARYERLKGGILSLFGLGKSFIEEFLDDIRSLQGHFDQITRTLEGKQYGLLKNVNFYDVFYQLNEQEVANLIYEIGVMEILRDMLTEKANSIPVGNSNLGDRGGEEQASILEVATLIENRITSFLGRLWVAWAMAPQVRTMRVISLGLSARIDQTVDVTIPTMKNTIVIWLTMTEAEQAEQINRAVEVTFNEEMTRFALAAKATVPLLANALSTTALDPKTIHVWVESIAAQADGMVAAIDSQQENRAAMEKAMIAGKGVIDESTQRVNQARLQQVLQAAQQAPLQIARSVPA